MKHPNADFVKNFVIKTKKEENEEKRKAQIEAFKAFCEESKKPFLTETTKNILEQVITKTTTTNKKSKFYEENKNSLLIETNKQPTFNEKRKKLSLTEATKQALEKVKINTITNKEPILNEENEKNLLTETTKQALEETISKTTTTNKQPNTKLKLSSNLNEQNQISEIQVQSPLIVKDNKIQLDFKSLGDILAKENSLLVQQTLDMMKVKTLDSVGLGGGGVGIVGQDEEGNDVRLLKSVSNLIFKGPGVEVQRKGKDVEIYVSSSIDTSADFPREASILEIYSAIQEINSNILELNGNNIPDALATVDYVTGTTWGYF
jgi:hypothetical protein